MQQRFLTDDEIRDAKAMVGWQFWFAPVLFVMCSLGLGIGALGGNLALIIVFLIVGSQTIVLSLLRLRDYKKVTHDIARRIVERRDPEPGALEMKNSKPSTKDEAQLNCVALRPQLDFEGAWRAVKGQDERQKTAPLTALHAPDTASSMSEKKNTEGRHVGLDFYDLLIEA